MEHRYSARARVRRGAARLDRHAPDWHLHIVPDRLDLDSLRDCVLGQVYGDFLTGESLLGLATWTDVRHHGFAARTRFGRRRLEREWRLQAMYRHNADRLLDDTLLAVNVGSTP